MILSGYRVGKPDGGPECERLEREIERFYTRSTSLHARVLNSATSALHAALVSIGVGPGDEVLVPAYSMSASASAVLHAGATPVFCDIGDDYCLDWNDGLARVTERTKAAVLVHLFGHHASVPGAFPLPVIHDCAQSPSVVPALRVGLEEASVSRRHVGAGGSLRLPVEGADCWVYSFNQWKIVSCGEGGAVVSFDRTIADRVHAVRNHGECYTDDVLGWNYRMTEPIAKIARSEFADLTRRLNIRFTWAAEKRQIHDLPGDPGNRDWFMYPIRVKSSDREAFAARVGGRVGYHRPIYRLPYFAKRFPGITLPKVEQIESELVVIDPMQDGV